MKWVFALALMGAVATHLSAAVPNETTQTKKTKTGRRARARHAAPAPSYQLQPDPERYQEIQKSLAEKGYFKGEANGIWGDDSIDALKRFQADQKLTDDGKINALTLIGLGLGPKHDGGSLPPPK